MDFTTYLVNMDEEFAPKVSGEHVGWAWAPIDQPPEPLHPGCRVALERFTMDELGIARAIRDGRLTSPQKYQNVWLFAMRITGTGAAYRKSWDEFVWRDPSIYMNEEFVERCNGLPVIMEHPPGAILNTAEFAKRAIGSIFLPYLCPDKQEVWGIAKIHDEDAADEMMTKQMSTSPSVVLDPKKNSKFVLENGKPLLIEGNPLLLDHLAVCEQGVWDKGGDPEGIQVDELAADDANLREWLQRADSVNARILSLRCQQRMAEITERHPVLRGE